MFTANTIQSLKRIGILSLISLPAVASAAIDIRLWLSPVSAGGIPFIGGGGPFSPVEVSASLPTGGIGAHIYTSDIVGPGGTRAPAPSVPFGQPGDIFAIWARTEGGTAPEGSAVRGIHLQVRATGSLRVSSAWVQWRSGFPPAPFQYRWEAASDFLQPEVTLLGGLGAAGRGWVLGPSTERLDNWQIVDEVLGTGDGEILLGFVRADEGVGNIQLRLGANGINHILGTSVAFGDGTEFISGTTGMSGRGYGDQAIIPEPLTAASLMIMLAFIRRR